MTFYPKLRVIEEGDLPVPSITESWGFWMDVFAGRIPELRTAAGKFKSAGYIFPGDANSFMDAVGRFGDHRVCLCVDERGNQSRHLYDQRFGWCYCLCYLLELRRNYETILSGGRYDSPHPEPKEFSFKGMAPAGAKSLKNAIETVEMWARRPWHVLVLSGPTGVGKSMMLNRIDAAWWPFSLYCVATDYANRVHSSLNSDAETFSHIQWVYKNWPLLMIDDFGLEHSSPWTHDCLEDLIEARTRIPGLATVIATNLTRPAIIAQTTRDGVSRIGSRILDQNNGTFVRIEAPDYRSMVHPS